MTYVDTFHFITVALSYSKQFLYNTKNPDKILWRNIRTRPTMCLRSAAKLAFSGGKLAFEASTCFGANVASCSGRSAVEGWQHSLQNIRCSGGSLPQGYASQFSRGLHQTRKQAPKTASEMGFFVVSTFPSWRRHREVTRSKVKCAFADMKDICGKISISSPNCELCPGQGQKQRLCS